MLLPGLFPLFSEAVPSQPHQSKYYEGQKWGWYWYQDPKGEQPQKTEETGKEAPVRQALPRLLEAYTYEQLWHMHPEEFRKLMTGYLERAVANPTPETVFDYMVLQDVARRKALAFTSVFTYLVQKYPELAGNLATYPIALPGIEARMKMTAAEVEAFIKKAVQDYGVVAFLSRDSSFSEVQLGILQYLEHNYGWPVKAVWVDTPEGEVAVRKFGVKVVPSVILVSRSTGQWLPVSVGITDLTTLKERMYRAARVLEGEEDPRQFILWTFEKGTAADPTTIPQLDRVLQEVYRNKP